MCVCERERGLGLGLGLEREREKEREKERERGRERKRQRLTFFSCSTLCCLDVGEFIRERVSGCGWEGVCGGEKKPIERHVAYILNNRCQ